MTENKYQAQLIKKLERRFYPCVVVKNDPTHIQGIPDITIFYGRFWAFLEVKASARSKIQPNQDHFVRQLDEMSFAAFIYPENEVEVLDALQQAFEIAGRTCVS